jgi:hypothetical protein
MTLSSSFILYSDALVHPLSRRTLTISWRSSSTMSGFLARSVMTWVTSSVVVWMAAKERMSCATAGS